MIQGENLYYITDNLALILLFIALPIFALLTIKSRNVRSFQFQISLFLIIWIIGEIADLLNGMGVIQLSSEQAVGQKIHVVAMAFFSLMLWLRFYLSRRSGKKLIDNLQED